MDSDTLIEIVFAKKWSMLHLIRVGVSVVRFLLLET